MLTANTIPFKNLALVNAINVSQGGFSVFDPYDIENTLFLIQNVKDGNWFGQSALFVESIDGFNLNVRYLETQLAITAYERNIDNDIIKRVHAFIGGNDWYFCTYSEAKAKLAECMGKDADELLSIVDDVVNGFEIKFEDDIDQVKHHTLRGAINELRHPWFDVENHKQMLSEYHEEIHNPAFGKVQYIHLKHADLSEFTPHESKEWVLLGDIDSSSGKLAIFDSSVVVNLDQQAQTLLDQAEKLCVEYNEELRRNPVNVRKIGSDAVGMATVTPNREHYNEVYAISQDGEIVEILIHFDQLVEDD